MLRALKYFRSGNGFIDFSRRTYSTSRPPRYSKYVKEMIIPLIIVSYNSCGSSMHRNIDQAFEATHICMQYVVRIRTVGYRTTLFTPVIHLCFLWTGKWAIYAPHPRNARAGRRRKYSPRILSTDIGKRQPSLFYISFESYCVGMQAYPRPSGRCNTCRSHCWASYPTRRYSHGATERTTRNHFTWSYMGAG